MRLNDMAKMVKTVGEPNRLAILCEIFKGQDLCVTELAKRSRMSTAVTSHHLRAMCKEKILVPVRHGKRICYELAPSPIVADLKKMICKYKNL